MKIHGVFVDEARRDFAGERGPVPGAIELGLPRVSAGIVVDREPPVTGLFEGVWRAAHREQVSVEPAESFVAIELRRVEYAQLLPARMFVVDVAGAGDQDL